MIKGFSEETQPLTEYERKVILPIILEGLKAKIGKANAVTNKYIISRLRDSYKKTRKAKVLPGFRARLRITRLRIRVRISALGFASTLHVWHGTRATNLQTYTNKF